MNIIFVGSMVKEDEIITLPAVSVAGNKMQLGILRGLYKLDNHTMAISAKPRRMFWGSKKDILINKHKRIYLSQIDCNEVFYINFIILKQISIFFSIFFGIIKQFIKTKKEKQVVIVYNTFSYMVLPSILACKLFKGICISIIADLPIKGENKGLLHKIEDVIEVKIISKLDAIIPLTKYIASDFAKGIPYLVIEAGHTIDIVNGICSKSKNKNNFNVVFSGSLNILSGIELALDTFKNLDKKYVLHIYGKGYKEEIVKVYAEKYTNIMYHGIINNDDMLKIQKQANILICPRMPDNYITRYTFPSKILEYMTSGVPVICNKLSGIPNEYYQFLNIPEKSDVDSWAYMIKIIAENMNGIYTLKAEKSQSFALEEKNWDKQCNKVYKFIEEVIISRLPLGKKIKL